MADQLTEAEELCKKTLNALQAISSPSTERYTELEKEILDLICRLDESKKKIMVRSPEGRALSSEVLNSALKTYEAASSLLKNDKNLKEAEVNAHLSQLKDRVEKLEIYWKSFEYVTT